MSALDSPPAARKAGDALLIARIWGGFMALCHLGGLAGAVVPLLLHTSYASGSYAAMTFVSLAHHIVALVAAVMLLIGLRSARFALLVAITLSIAHCFSVVSISPFAGVVAFGFGLFLYVPPLVLIYWRPQEFR